MAMRRSSASCSAIRWDGGGHTSLRQRVSAGRPRSASPPSTRGATLARELRQFAGRLRGGDADNAAGYSHRRLPQIGVATHEDVAKVCHDAHQKASSSEAVYNRKLHTYSDFDKRRFTQLEAKLESLVAKLDTCQQCASKTENTAKAEVCLAMEYRAQERAELNSLRERLAEMQGILTGVTDEVQHLTQRLAALDDRFLRSRVTANENTLRQDLEQQIRHVEQQGRLATTSCEEALRRHAGKIHRLELCSEAATRRLDGALERILALQELHSQCVACCPEKLQGCELFGAHVQYITQAQGRLEAELEALSVRMSLVEYFPKQKQTPDLPLASVYREEDISVELDDGWGVKVSSHIGELSSSLASLRVKVEAQTHRSDAFAARLDKLCGPSTEALRDDMSEAWRRDLLAVEKRMAQLEGRIKTALDKHEESISEVQINSLGFHGKIETLDKQLDQVSQLRQAISNHAESISEIHFNNLSMSCNIEALDKQLDEVSQLRACAHPCDENLSELASHAQVDPCGKDTHAESGLCRRDAPRQNVARPINSFELADENPTTIRETIHVVEDELPALNTEAHAQVGGWNRRAVVEDRTARELDGFVRALTQESLQSLCYEFSQGVSQTNQRMQDFVSRVESRLDATDVSSEKAFAAVHGVIRTLQTETAELGNRLQGSDWIDRNSEQTRSICDLKELFDALRLEFDQILAQNDRLIQGMVSSTDSRPEDEHDHNKMLSTFHEAIQTIQSEVAELGHRCQNRDMDGDWMRELRDLETTLRKDFANESNQKDEAIQKIISSLTSRMEEDAGSTAKAVVDTREAIGRIRRDMAALGERCDCFLLGADWMPRIIQQERSVRELEEMVQTKLSQVFSILSDDKLGDRVQDLSERVASQARDVDELKGCRKFVSLAEETIDSMAELTQACAQDRHEVDAKIDDLRRDLDRVSSIKTGALSDIRGDPDEKILDASVPFSISARNRSILLSVDQVMQLLACDLNDLSMSSCALRLQSSGPTDVVSSLFKMEAPQTFEVDDDNDAISSTPPRRLEYASSQINQTPIKLLHQPQQGEKANAAIQQDEQSADDFDTTCYVSPSSRFSSSNPLMADLDQPSIMESVNESRLEDSSTFLEQRETNVCPDVVSMTNDQTNAEVDILSEPGIQSIELANAGVQYFHEVSNPRDFNDIRAIQTNIDQLNLQASASKNDVQALTQDLLDIRSTVICHTEEFARLQTCLFDIQNETEKLSSRQLSSARPPALQDQVQIPPARDPTTASKDDLQVLTRDLLAIKSTVKSHTEEFKRLQICLSDVQHITEKLSSRQLASTRQSQGQDHGQVPQPQDHGQVSQRSAQGLGHSQFTPDGQVISSSPSGSLLVAARDKLSALHDQVAVIQGKMMQGRNKEACE